MYNIAVVSDHCQELNEHWNPVPVATEIGHVVRNVLVNEIYTTHSLVVVVDK
jgi:hypothetical protein